MIGRTLTGLDANSISFNPLFVNPNGSAATVDLHIQPGSPVIARPTVAGIANDFDGDIRNPTTPDIGSDERLSFRAECRDQQTRRR